MPAYYGPDKIGDIRSGNDVIDRVYYGSILVYQRFKDIEITTPGTYVYNLPAGEYRIVMRGSGGAGGQSGGNGGGAGGAGGYGDLVTITKTLAKKTSIEVCLGTPGSVDGNGGNGGLGKGRSNWAPGLNGGKGGGGAFPSYIKFGTKITSEETLYRLQTPCYAWKLSGTIVQYGYTFSATPKVGDKLYCELNGSGNTYFLIRTIESINGTTIVVSTEGYTVTSTYTRSSAQDKSEKYECYAKTESPEVGDYIYDSTGEFAGSITKIEDPGYPNSAIRYTVMYSAYGLSSWYHVSNGSITIQRKEEDVVYALGGGGGGGGGGAATGGRYSPSGGGGGGGGFYGMTNGYPVSYAGQVGGNSGGADDGLGGVGANGNSMFPQLYGGHNGRGGYYDELRGSIRAGGTGGGASGAGGNGGAGNHSSSRGGGSGGGAGGDMKSHGGQKGVGKESGQDGSNFKQTADDISQENITAGIPANCGKGGDGGAPSLVNGTDGQSGYIKIERLYPPVPELFDLMFIVEDIDEYINCGNIYNMAVTVVDDGLVTQNVSSSVDYGSVSDAVTTTEQDGPIFIPEQIDETIDNGEIYG